MPRVVPSGRLTALQKVVLAAEIAIAYAKVRSRLRREDIRKIVGDLGTRGAARAGTPRRMSPDCSYVALRLGNAVGRTLRFVPGSSRCLVESLVLSELLSARGISSTLVIGAHSSPSFDGPSFVAHAWVECAGRPVLPPRGFAGSRLLQL